MRARPRRPAGGARRGPPRAALAAGLVLALACGSGLRGPATSPGEQRDYAAAVRVLAADPAAGRAALEAFLAARPASALADDAMLRLAEQDLREGSRDAARARLRALVEAHPTADASDEARLALARLERDRGDLAEAYRQATSIRLSLLDREERRGAHRLLADLAGARGDTAARLRWLSRVRADRTTPEETAAVDAEIDAALAAMDDAALATAAEQLGKRVPAARVRLRQAELALAAGDPARAAELLAAARKLPLVPPDARRLAELEAQAGAGAESAGLWRALPDLGQAEARDAFVAAGAEGTLGVVLPLSGRLASFGEESLEGILLATGHFDALGAGSRSRVRLRVRDTEGSPAAAAAAVRELAADASVSAILGPLTGEEAEAAARAAEESAVPLLALTGREDVARLGRFALRFGASAPLEAAFLADYAVAELGLRRIAILYPDDEYGLAVRAAFWDAAVARGAEIVGVARYPVGATDFAEPIRSLIGYRMLSAGERAALAERERLRKRARRLGPEAAARLRRQADALTGPGGTPLPPFVDFEALFVPDGHERVALIAPHLAFHEVQGVRLLGSHGWNHPDLIRIGGSHVEGALFTVPFHAESHYPLVEEFARRYAATFTRAPDFLAAQAFDTANLALLQLLQGRRDREALLEGLLAVRAHPGVAGTVSVAPDGNALRRPYLLRVEDGRFVSVGGAEPAPYLRLREGVSAADPEHSLP